MTPVEEMDDLEERIRRLRAAGEDVADAEEELARARELLEQRRHQESATLMGRVRGSVRDAQIRFASWQRGNAATAGFVIAVVIVLVALYYSSSSKNPLDFLKGLTGSDPQDNKRADTLSDDSEESPNDEHES